jgi:dephospho-CoA kinase
LLVSPLLLETEQHKLAQRILIVDVCEHTQIERTLQRDQSSKSTIKSIIESQMGREDRLSKADDIIDNEQTADAVKLRVATLHKTYLELAQTEDEGT